MLGLLLKQRAPDIKIILGGANCDGAMGEALLRGFPWIDAVVRGEAEPVFGGSGRCVASTRDAGAESRIVRAHTRRRHRRAHECARRDRPRAPPVR